AGGDGREEVARDQLAAPGEPGLPDAAPRALDDRRDVEEDAAQGWVGGEDAGDQRTLSAAHVDQRAEAREVVRGRHRRVEGRGERGHGGVEERGPLGVPGAFLEKRLRPARAPHRLAAHHAPLELAPGVPVPLVAEEDRGGAERARGGAPEQRTERARCKAAVCILVASALAHQSASPPTEGQPYV